MVNKKIIEKLSDRELENYIKPDSRFVSTAISHAYEILQSRGRTFDDSEKLRIEQMISDKSNTEQSEKTEFSKGWDQNMTQNETAIELYPNKFIWIYSIIFGVLFGSVLQAMNFHRLQKLQRRLHIHSLRNPIHYFPGFPADLYRRRRLQN